MPSTISAGTTAGTAIAIAGDTTGALALQTNGTTTAMTIDTSQNVGIGTSSPAQKLQVSGGSATVVARFNGGNTGLDITPNDATGITDIATSPLGGGSKAMTFTTYTGSTSAERMRISSAGTLFIGGTSSPTGTQRLVLTADGAAGTEPMLVNELRTGNSNENAIRFYRNGSQVGTITTNASNTSYNTSSDYRLKENIAPMTGALATVALLKPCTYTWKSTGETGQGFIAHELQAVVPDAVNGEKDAVDAEGKPVYQGVDTSFLVATLTAAIQELKAELDATKAEVAALKGA